MPRNQNTYELKINANLESLQKGLITAKQSLSELFSSGNAPKGLEKSFNKINELLGQIQDKAGRPLNLKGLTGTEKDLGTVQDNFRAIVRLLGEFKDLSDDAKLSFLTNEDQKKVLAATEALKKYQAALEEVAAKEKALATTRKNAEKDETKLKRAEGKVVDIQNKKDKVTATKNTKKGQLSALQALGDKADPVRVAKLEGEIEELNTEITTLEKSASAAAAEVTELKQALESSSTSVATLEKEIKQKSTKALSDLKAEAEALGIAVNDLDGKDAAKQMEILSKRVTDFKSTVSSNGEKAFNKIKNGCKRSADAVRGLEDEVREGVKAVEAMDQATAERDAFEGRIKQFLGLSGAAHVLRSALRDAMQTIRDLDQSMTEMAVVTDLTIGDYWDQLPEYSQRASELGVSIKSAYEAATLYYQQGLKTNEVNAISTETLKMAKIAGLDAAEATDKMTAALRGFNMELNDTSAQRVSDVYSELAAITAADTKEIANAMTKTASIAHSAGMEFETTAAFLSQIIETTRESAETAGTAMKTVIARFQELKKDPAEIGEVDGEIVDANAIETALRSVGVSLRDTNGQFRELDDVFLELSSKWDGLDKNTQRYIATIAAGSRQQSRFIAMMQDYSRTQELVTAANSSAGASQRQFEKTLEGMEAKLEKLKNAWHEFTMGIMNSDLLKAGVDILTKFLEVVNKATAGFGGMTSSFLKIASLIGIFKMGRKIFEKFEDPVIKLFSKIRDKAYEAGLLSGEAYEKGLRKAQEKDGGGEKQSKPAQKLEKGYYKDKNGKVHRADGKFAKSGEGIVPQKAPSEPRNRYFAQRLDEGYYRDKSGKVHRPDGKFAKSGEGLLPDGAAGVKAGLAKAWGGAKTIVTDRTEAGLTGAVKNVGVGLKQAGGAALHQLGESTGIAQIFTTSAVKDLKKQFQAEDNKKKATIDKKQKRFEAANERYEKAAANQYENPEEYAAAVQEIGEAQEDLVKTEKEYEASLAQTNEERKKMLQDAKSKDFENIANGLGKMGQAAVAAGTGISVMGGILSSLGLEEFGDILSKVGNGITIFGSVLMTLPSIFSAISAAATAAGITISAALWIVTLIVLAVAAVAGTIAAIVMTIQKNSPKAKLENAAKASKDAEEAANNAKEAYEGLGNALADLETKYDAMDDMVKGTDEWNKALQEANSAVLDLIEKYPELAGLVERTADGELKLDTDSDEVQKVMKEYENKATVARGVALGAKADLQAAQDTMNFSELDAISRVSNQRGWQTAGTWMASSTAIGASAGAASSLALGPFAPIVAPITTAIGAITGAATGIVGSAIAGPIAAAGAKTDEALQEATEELAKSVEAGETELEFEAMKDFLIEQGVAADEARVMAESFAENTDQLREFGKSVLASEAATDAYYSAMASNAQQMLDLGNYSQEEITQMNQAVDTERMKAIEDAKKAEISGMKKEDKKKAKEDFAKEQYGSDAIVDGNKIIYYEDGEKKEKVFEDDDAWVNAIAAAEATKDAAAAMEKVPVMIDNMVKKFNSEGKNGSVIEKGLTDATKLTKNDLQSFKDTVGLTTDKNGNLVVDSGENSALKAIWNDESMKKDLEAIYGDYETFIAEYQDIIKEQDKAWKNIEESAEKLGFDKDENGNSIISNMSSGAAKAWTNLLKDVMPTGTSGGADEVNAALGNFLAGMDQEDIDSIMSQIGAIDKTDANAWDNLAHTLEEMKLVTDASDSSLQTFIEKAKQATNAIRKVDFSTFNQQINHTIELLNKIQDGARAYSEDDYKSLIAANKDLKNEFVQIGDQFIYLGSTMEQLTTAVKENTVAILQEANFLLAAQAGMAEILEERSAIDTDSSVNEQRLWLTETVAAFAKSGYDVKNLGIEGLALNTDFSNLSSDKVKDMVAALLGFRGRAGQLRDQQSTKMREANVAAYTLNSAKFNSEQGAGTGEWADEHRDALLAQGVQAGVGEAMLQKYSEAVEKFEAGEISQEAFKEISDALADMVELTEEVASKEKELNALMPLTEKVAAAIEKQRQSVIDKLSDVNDSINSANEALLGKIQEQIDEDRQAREREKMEDNLSDLRSQQAYLAMDSSGANALSMLQNEKAIKEAEEEYQDTLIDQSIQKLEDANQQAAEQRERQINLLQQQLDYDIQNGTIAEQASQVVNESLEQIMNGQDVTQTKLGEYMQGEIDELQGLQKEEARNSWDNMIISAINGLKPEETEDTTNVTNDQSGGSGGTSDTSGSIGHLNEQSAKAILGSAKDIAAKRFQEGSGTRSNYSSQLQQKEEAYINAFGNLSKEEREKKRQEFRDAIGNVSIESGSLDGVEVTGVNSWDRWETVTAKFPGGDTQKFTFDRKEHQADENISKELTRIVGGSPKDTWMAMYKSEPYIYYNKAWHTIDNNPNTGTAENYKNLKSKYKAKLNSVKKYKTGGLADFTGPAWLDGTKSKPEIVLNQRDSANFLVLRDILGEILNNPTGSQSASSSGDNHFEIEINVEKLENDYDVEQLANKIRKMLYEDAQYRNVNAVGFIR